MVVLSIATYIFVGLYGLMVVAFAIGWLRLPHFSEKTPIDTPISLVVCCKNEAENLPHLLATIAQQTHTNFEVIFANDHSTDATAKILDEFCQKHAFARYFDTVGDGKKNALREAIARTHHATIVCSDADCTLPPKHLQTIADFFAKNAPDLLIGSVKMAHNGTLFQQLQALEFASLVASTAGACGVGTPIMCNGANLAFKKQMWQKCDSLLHDDQPSGDDVFLLHAIKKIGGKIAFLKSENAVVTTQPQPTLGRFVRQRTRWSSKAAAYTDAATIAVACVVFLVSLLILVDFIGIFLHFATLVPFFVAFGAKFAIDTAFLALFLPFMRQSRLLLHTPLLSAIYPIYIAYTALRGLTGKVRWK